MSSGVIVFENVSKEYELYTGISYKEIFFNFFRRNKVKIKRRFTALEEISFSIQKGEVVGIIGKNGSGKSTTLGLMAGVLKQTGGQIYVRQRVSPLLELGGGFHPELNAYENIRLNGVLLGIPLNVIEQNKDEIISFAEIEEFADQPIRTYSSGMKARLGFSIVTQLQPELLLIDEVLAVGDERFRDKCLGVMKNFKQMGITMIFVSHNADEVRQICDRVIWIDRHKIRMDGKAEEVLKAYETYMKEGE